MRRPREAYAGLLLLGLGILWALALPLVAAAAENKIYERLDGFRMIDQDGRSAELRDDLIADNLAVVTFTFTSCTTVCPVLDGIFRKVQELVGDDLGREVTLLTISVDPHNDIPERLKQRAERLSARPGWYFLTGEKPRVDAVLKAFEVYTADIYNHPPTIFVLDGRTRSATRLSGFPSPGAVLTVIKEYQAARNGA